MRRHPRPANIGNLSYQHQLASLLVRSLGVTGAIDACFQNEWTGTLGTLLKDKRSKP